MYYAGKMLDLFESAMNQMLENAGIGKVNYLDCISRRSFGFTAGIEEKERFCPYIALEEAASHLSLELGIKLVCRKIMSIGEIPRCEKPMVLGPLKEGVAVKGIREYYYNGKCHYIFVEKIEGERFRAFDPRGIPGLYVPKEKMTGIIAMSKPYIIYLEDFRKNCREPESSHIFKEGIKYHNRIKRNESEEIKNIIQMYKKGRGNSLSLQYGILNACLQIDKNFLLAEECGKISETVERKYYICKQSLYKAVQNEKIETIPEIWNRIWELLEYGL